MGTAKNLMKIAMFIIITFFTVMIYNGSAKAGDPNMQKNLSNLSELTSMWSKSLTSGKMSPEAQAKLAELLSQTSRVLQDLSEKSGGAMHMEHSMKIEGMKKAWDPFDTSDKM